MSHQLNVEIFGQKKSLPFPTNGQIIDMDSMRGSFGLLPAGRGGDILEAMIFFQKCWPEILEERKLDDAMWVDVSYPEVAPFVYAYVNEIKPWLHSVYNDLDAEFNKAIEKKERVDKAIEKEKKY